MSASGSISNSQINLSYVDYSNSHRPNNKTVKSRFSIPAFSPASKLQPSLNNLSQKYIEQVNLPNNAAFVGILGNKGLPGELGATGAESARDPLLISGLPELIREPGNIYITGHRVAGGPYHTAIEYVNSNSKSSWLSAGPVGASREGLVSLVGAPNRPSDRPENNTVFGKVTPPQGMTTSDYFEVLKDKDAFYCDCADYDLFPGLSNGYNSNSYVNSILKSTGGTSTVNLDDFIGGGKIIPGMYFE